ncbi:MAG: AI-2E family transporter, partial [Alphaproteobacteria bacterium]
VLVAFADDPAKALWIAVFYLAMNEVMGDLVTPRIRASTMNLHPASTLAMVLVMGAAFGIPGALIATPMAAFVKAYFEEFHLAGRPVDSAEQERVDAMLAREADAA